MRTFASNCKASILRAAHATSPRILLASAVFSRFGTDNRRSSALSGWTYLRYPLAAFTLSGVKGACRKRTPVSCMTAFEIAGATSGVDI